MSQLATYTTDLQKKLELANLPEPKRARQPEQGAGQQVAPQAVYHRAQLNPNGLRPADILALQRTVGNRGMQRILARRVDGATDQQQGALPEENPELKVQTKPSTVGVGLQRQCAC